MAFNNASINDLPEYVAPTSTSRAISTAFDLGLGDRVSVSLGEYIGVKLLQQKGERLPVEELNKQFPESRFNEPMTLAAAAYTSDSQKSRKYKEDIIANNDTILGGVIAPFGARAVGSILDPTDVFLNVATGFGASAIAKKVGKEALSKSFAFNLGENLLANTIAEGAVVARDNAEQMDYTAAQFMANVVGGTVLFTAGLKGIGLGLEKLRAVKGDGLAKTLTVANRAALTGKSPQKIIDPLLKHLEKDMEFTPEIKAAFKEAYPEGRYADAESMPEAYQMLREDIGNGVVDANSVSTFRDLLQSQEIGEDSLKYFDSYVKNEIPEDIRTEVASKMEDPEANYGYSSDATKAASEIPQRMEEDVLLTNIENELEPTIGRLSGDELLDPEIKGFVERIDNDFKFDSDLLEAQKNYADCIIGGGF